MGRLATNVAAAATMADNLPQKLPRVSLLDALLPRSITTPPKPLGTSTENISPGVGDHEIRKNKRGKMFMVHHKGSSSRAGSAVEITDGKDGDKVSAEDVKKTTVDGDGKKDQAEAEEKKSGADENQSGFTAEEDAKLIELKTAGKASKSWKEIAEEMGRSQQELKERWKAINPNAQGDGKGSQEGQGKDAKQNDQGGKQEQCGGGGDQKKGNDNQNKGAKNQQGGGKKGKGNNKEWTSDEDAKLKEMWAADKPWGELQAEFHCGMNIIEARWKEIGDSTEPAKQDSNNKKPDPNAPWTEEDDKLLKELWENNASWKDLKSKLHRSKPAIEARWKEISKADEPKKSEANPEEPKEEPKEEESKKEEPKKDEAKKEEAKKEEPKKASSAKAQSAKSASVVSKARSHRSEARFTMGEWMTLQEDELFTFQELQLLSHIIMRDPSQSWLRVASSFHDKTGRRVHPDDIREKFEAMAAMG